MLLLKDEYTGYAWCFFLRKKKQAAETVQHFFALVERQFDTKIKGLRSRPRRRVLVLGVRSVVDHARRGSPTHGPLHPAAERDV
jgi:hypothetical protein